MTRFLRSAALAAFACLILPAAVAQAADPASCKTVQFSDVGWTDITATTAITSRILEGLGYEPKIQVLSVPVTYTSMKNKDIDVFLGNWMPTMEADRKPYVEDKSVDVIGRQSRRREVHPRGPEVSLRPGPQELSPTSRSSRASSPARSTASSRATTATA